MMESDINLPLSDIKEFSFQGRELLPTMQEDLSGAYAWRLRNGSVCSFREKRTNSPHSHPDGFETCLVLEGRGEYLHGGEKLPLGPGDLFLANPNVVHEISSHKTGDLLLAFFVFYAQKADFEERQPGKAGMLIERFLSGHSVLASGCEDLADYAKLLTRRGRSCSPELGVDTLWRAFAFECLERLCAVKTAPEGGRRRELPPLDKALEYMRENASRPIGAEDLAKAAGLSSRQLRRLVKSEMGCEMRDLIADARIQRSLHLLSMRFSVSEVAKAIGESSQAQFCRLFKRRVGVTPKEYQMTHAPRRSAEQSARPSRLR